ncbi:MAG: hypothetical protein R2784_17770 [Saprospiraceae bacterium]
MGKRHIPESELVVNQDGSIYHLRLKPEQVADTILLVGDQNRVGRISKYFDSIEHEVQFREFVTHTGYVGEKKEFLFSLLASALTILTSYSMNWTPCSM